MIGILTHYDLDGLGCLINIWNSLSEEEKREFHYVTTAYYNLEENIKKLNKKYSKVYITDLNLTRSQIDLLKEIQTDELIYIDHHYYNFPVKEVLEQNNFKCFLDENFSGTINSYRFLLKHSKIFKNKRNKLKVLNKYIDFYDCWRIEKEEFFKNSIGLNAYFWEIGLEKFFIEFRENSEEQLGLIKDEIENKHLEFKEEVDKIVESSFKIEDIKTILIFDPRSKYTTLVPLFYNNYLLYIFFKKRIGETLIFSLRLNKDCDFYLEEIFGSIYPKFSERIKCLGNKKSGAIEIKGEYESVFEEIFNLIYSKISNKMK